MSQGSRLSVREWWIGGALAALAVTVYANALANGLVWDDPIVLNRQLLAFKSLRDLVFTPRHIPQYAPDYYRPLTVLTYLIDRGIGGSGPFMFHASVVIFHACTTFLVFWCGLALWVDSPVRLPAAALGAALFAVHPIHAESVAWGAGRSDVLASGFAVGSVLALLQRRWNPLRRASTAALVLFIAMLAKETAIGLFVLLPFADLILGRWPRATPVPAARAERRRRQQARPEEPSRAWFFVPFAAAFVVYIWLRQATLGTTFGQANALSSDSATKVVGALGLYIAKLLLPIRQSAYISDVPTNMPALAATAIILIGVLWAGVVAWRRGERVVVFLLLWIGLTLAPSLAIVVKIQGAPVAERYLYMPSVGFCLLAGYGVARLLAAVHVKALRAAVGIACGVMLVVAAAAAVRRNGVWRSNLTLWEDTVAKNTTDGLPLRSLAAVYMDLGDSVKAADYFQRALQRRNDAIGRFTIANNLGSLAMYAHRLDEAEGYYRTALSIDPGAPDCLYNLGLIALTRSVESGQAETVRRAAAQQARQWFEQAARLSPLDPEIEVGLGQALEAVGDSSGARAHYERALQLGLPAPTEDSVRKLLAALPVSEH